MVNNSRWSKRRWRTLVQLRIFYNSKFHLPEDELAFKDELFSKSKDFFLRSNILRRSNINTRFYILPFHSLLLILFSKYNYTKTFIPINIHSEKDRQLFLKYDSYTTKQ